ncbi:Imm50 family immunity protein [Melghirimyces thermohalophilus]|uniref:Imm50 family immunity protein n=1 Tax=Melghirimyces thermohalophilus TaxID=1236220 RepID=UPI000B828E37|nr:Imm50 family immunity protein [Melghirimyces thermohalophilus]
MTLFDLVSNPQSLISLYGDWPSFKGGRITSMELVEDGPTINIIVQLTRVPQNPPQRWKRNKFNAVSIEISFFGVESISMTDWSINNVIEKLLIQENADCRVPWKRIDCCTKEGVQFCFQCIDIRIKSIIPILIDQE